MDRKTETHAAIRARFSLCSSSFLPCTLPAGFSVESLTQAVRVLVTSLSSSSSAVAVSRDGEASKRQEDVDLARFEFYDVAEDALGLNRVTADALFELFLSSYDMDVSSMILRVREELGAYEEGYRSEFSSFQTVPLIPFFVFLFAQLAMRHLNSTVPQLGGDVHWVGSSSSNSSVTLSKRNSHYSDATLETSGVVSSTSSSRSPNSSPVHMQVNHVAVEKRLQLEAAYCAFLRKHIPDLIHMLDVMEDGHLSSTSVRALDILFQCFPSGSNVPISLISMFGDATQISATAVQRSLLDSFSGGDIPLLDALDDSYRMGVYWRNWFVLHGLSKQTLFRTSDDFRDVDVRISGCSQVTLYLLTPLRSVSLVGLRRCTIVLGPVARTLHVEHCESSVIIAPCRGVLFSDCVDLEAHICVNSRPLVLPSCRDVVIGPYHTFYGSLHNDLQTAGVVPTLNKWNEYMIVQPSTANASSLIVRPEDPSRFVPFVIPIDVPGDSNYNPCVVPEEYVDGLRSRHEKAELIRAKVSKIIRENGQNIGDEIRAHVLDSFKDWLGKSGRMRQMNELARASSTRSFSKDASSDGN